MCQYRNGWKESKQALECTVQAFHNRESVSGSRRKQLGGNQSEAESTAGSEHQPS